MVDTLDNFVYNNEEESEMGQLHAIHLNYNAVAAVRRQVAAQSKQPSLSHCEECGDEIPPARQRLIPGVRLCVYCKHKMEKAATN